MSGSGFINGGRHRYILGRWYYKFINRETLVNIRIWVGKLIRKVNNNRS